MVHEAKLEDGVPQTGGWFVVNARAARWQHNDMGWYCNSEGEGDGSFGQLGINLNVLPPGKPMAMYHQEPGQEDFLVLRGECVLIVEGQERPLRQWDFFHCPPNTLHTIVGSGDKPALVVAVGARKGPASSYPYDETAARYGAGVESEGQHPRDAYARYGPLETVPAPEI